MLRILIVDDEVLIREGLSRMIEKESGLFRVVGQFPDGKDVLDSLPGLEVDVVITDIRMPIVDGLDLIKQLKAARPHVRSILMSGFTEFNYAREAIRASAVDYLLKPINKEQLFELLYQLDEEHQSSLEKEALSRKRLLHSCFLSESPLPYLSEDTGLPLSCYATFVQKGGSLEAAAGRIQQHPELVCDWISVQERMLAWVFYFPEAPGHEQLDRIARLLGGAEEQSEEETAVHIGFSRSHNGTAELRASYEEAMQACDLGLYSESSLYYAAGYAGEAFGDIVEAEDAVRGMNLAEQLQLLHIPVVLECVRQCFERLKEQRAGTGTIVRVCSQLEDMASREVQEYREIRSKEARARLETQLRACMSFSDMEECFVEAFRSALEKVYGLRSEMGGKAVEIVKRWIAEHYSEHAELNTLAAMVYLTPSYLSKLFKQETGLTLTEYITHVRLKNAKRLLRTETNMKVHQIGAEVGYADPAYFNKLFKKVVGVTPNEYKKWK
ncbi:response regulator [Paenibacillus cellulositrophicus]|uniref:response regulator n=1 Tax=Paenibacillus cellulositrophicus TaxID=562959 RepID=UPI001267396B|nr:response regulator [Paenibacillus cellulositrophicus]